MAVMVNQSAKGQISLPETHSRSEMNAAVLRPSRLLLRQPKDRRSSDGFRQGYLSYLVIGLLRFKKQLFHCLSSNASFPCPSIMAVIRSANPFGLRI